MRTKKELLAAWYDDVWVHGDIDAIDRYFKPGVSAHGILPDLALDTGDLRDLVMAVRNMLGEIEINIIHSIEEKDWICCIVGVSSRAADSDAPVHVFGQVMTRIEDGCIAEAYNAFDFLTFFEQLGQLPENALPLMLSGARLR